MPHSNEGEEVSSDSEDEDEEDEDECPMKPQEKKKQYIRNKLQYN